MVLGYVLHGGHGGYRVGMRICETQVVAVCEVDGSVELLVWYDLCVCAL
jgi:hypothetical protein